MMTRLRRSTWIVIAVVLISTGAAFVTMATVPPPATPKAAVPRPAVPKAAAPALGAPPPPEESATIRDDPTIAPDPKQSADNDISFPSDT
jgi:hypothetical protein